MGTDEGEEEGNYELGIEFCKAGLAGVVEDEDGVDHGGGVGELCGVVDWKGEDERGGKGSGLGVELTR